MKHLRKPTFHLCHNVGWQKTWGRPSGRPFLLGGDMKRKLTIAEVAEYKLKRYKCDYAKLMQERIGAADRHGKQPEVRQRREAQGDTR